MELGTWVGWAFRTFGLLFYTGRHSRFSRGLLARQFINHKEVKLLYTLVRIFSFTIHRVIAFQASASTKTQRGPLNTSSLVYCPWKVLRVVITVGVARSLDTMSAWSSYVTSTYSSYRRRFPIKQLPNPKALQGKNAFARFGTHNFGLADSSYEGVSPTTKY